MEIENMIAEIFGHEVPVSGTVYRMWEQANHDDLLAAFIKIQAHNANLWAFGADERHFEQFADSNDTAALMALTEAEASALIGPDWQ